MVNRKIGSRTSAPVRQGSGGPTRTKAAAGRSAAPAGVKKGPARPPAAKPAARGKTAPPKAKAAPVRGAKTGSAKTGAGKSGSARTRPVQASPAKARAAKAPATKAPAAKAAQPKPASKAPAPVRKPAAGTRSAAVRDDEARARVRLLEQERTELQRLGDQMRAELDSALAEAARLRDRLREQGRDLESTPHPAATEPAPVGPAAFDVATDLDEDLPPGSDDDLEETAGFFDRMDEIRARRNELDRERNDRELEQSDQPFWMICPKCGDLMEESEGENVKLERCENCGGLYLDRGEVDLILSLCTGPDAYRRLHNILKF